MGIPPQINLVYVDRTTKIRSHVAGYFRIGRVSEKGTHFTQRLRIYDDTTHAVVLEVIFVRPKALESALGDSAKAWLLEIEAALQSRLQMSDGSIYFVPREGMEFTTIDLTKTLGTVDFHVGLLDKDVYICTDIPSQRDTENVAFADAVVFQAIPATELERSSIAVILKYDRLNVSIAKSRDELKDFNKYFLPFRKPLLPLERVSVYQDESALPTNHPWTNPPGGSPVKDTPYLLRYRTMGGLHHYSSPDETIAFTLEKDARRLGFAMVTTILDESHALPNKVKGRVKRIWDGKLASEVEKHGGVSTAKLLELAFTLSKNTRKLDETYRTLILF